MIILFKIPSPKNYISEDSKSIGKNYALQIYNETFDYLKSRYCADLVNPQLVESYAQMMARHIQLESLLSQSGFIVKHPTTGEPIPSPLAKMSLDYLNQANSIWNKINKVIEDYSCLE